jgi:hypothetical protein
MLGVGVASGKDRAEQAALSATAAPLIQKSIERATGEGHDMIDRCQLHSCQLQGTSTLCNMWYEQCQITQVHLSCMYLNRAACCATALLPAGIVYNITGGTDLTLQEVNKVRHAQVQGMQTHQRLLLCCSAVQQQ